MDEEEEEHPLLQHYVVEVETRGAIRKREDNAGMQDDQELSVRKGLPLHRPDKPCQALPNHHAPVGYVYSPS